VERGCVKIKFTTHSLNQIDAGRKLVTRRTAGLVKVNLCPNAWILHTKLEQTGHDDLGRLVVQFEHREMHSRLVCKSQYKQGQTLETNRGKIIVEEIEIGRIHDVGLNEFLLEGAESLCEFIATWDAINGQFGYWYSRNPWCWRYRFEVVK
jgi:hypothetical protein